MKTLFNRQMARKTEREREIKSKKKQAPNKKSAVGEKRKRHTLKIGKKNGSSYPIHHPQYLW
jgi:hypothetical protein